MTTIKFSHTYLKLWEQKKGELIAVRILDARSVAVNKALLDYDTMYFDDLGNPEYYELSKEGKLIQLIFIGNFEIPFCTLRRYTKEKFEYYQNNIGEVFNIVIEEEK